MKNEIASYRKKNPSPITVHLPVSKSEYNRASIISYLSGRQVILKNHSDAGDSVKMDDLLSMISDGKSFYVNCGAAGTTFRFLVSVAAISDGEWTLTGTERMKERPIRILVEALRSLSAEINYLEKEGFPPLKIRGKRLSGGTVNVDAGISSQFISSLMLIGPLLENGLEIIFNSKPVSLPYILMTSSIMRQCGAEARLTENKINVLPKFYQSAEITCENDWSAASYFYSMVAVDPTLKIILPGLKSDSIQGDSVVKEIYTQFGIITVHKENEIEIFNNRDVFCDYFEYDFTECPDLAQTMAFTCCAMRIPGKLTGLSTLKNKETDRIIALKNEMEKCGMKVEVTDDSLKFSPENDLPKSLEIKTYDDHRMAMAGYVMGFVIEDLTIENKNVVVKSFPKFWEECGKLF